MDDTPVDAAPTSGSANLVTSGGVYDAINTLSEGIPSGGEVGQVWTSDGAGAGKWADPTGIKSLIDSISKVATITKKSITVLQEFEIQYIYMYKYYVYISGWIKVSPGVYSSTNDSKVYLANMTMIDFNGKAQVCAIWSEPSDPILSCGSYASIITTENVSNIDTSNTYYRYRIRA